MKPRIFNLTLLAAATDLPDVPGTATPPAATEQPQKPNPPPDAVKPPTASGETETKPSLLQMAHAAVSSKQSLITEIAQQKQKITSIQSDLDHARSELTTAQTELSTARTELANLRKERADLEAALKVVEKENQTAEAAAVGIVATMGVAPEKLPTSAVAGESKEELMAQLNKETDSAKRFILAEKINALA